MKHVIITGGAGFIGSHLCESFLERGYAVTALDDFVTGRAENVAALIKHPDFDLVECDVSHKIPEHKLSNMQHGLHGILHFACPASPVDFQKIPFEILRVDSLGTMITVDLALRFNARYLLASTSEIYGDPLVHPQKEDYFGNVNTLGPRACYDEAKRFAEAFVNSAMRHHSLNAGIVRIFNTYGPRMRPDDGRIIPEFMGRGLQGESIRVCGDGLQTRSFCFVSDLVEGIVRFYESSVQDVINLGNPDERSVLEVAQLIREMTGDRSPIHHVPAREDDPRRRCPVIDKAERLLDWRPQVDLTEGLERTLKYFRTATTEPVTSRAPARSAVWAAQ
ncbi:MAG: NAD-dependent epimerase/dehydratase family protein [Bdellovibrionales bacterium]